MSHYKIIAIDNRRAEDIAYTDRMAKSLSEVKREKVSRIGQLASTRATLERDPSRDEEHFNRSLPENWQAIPGAKTIGESVGAWSGSMQDGIIVERLRRSEKNSLGDAISEGASSVSEESKNRATSAFTCSPPAHVTPELKDKIIAITGYTPLPPPIEEPKESYLDVFLKLFESKPAKTEIDRSSIAYQLYRLKGGRDKDFK